MFASPSSEGLPEGGGFTQAEATDAEITGVMSGRPGQITHRLSVVSHISFTSTSPPFVLCMGLGRRLRLQKQEERQLFKDGGET